mgnify:FL=1|jgi:hypothetical protein
MAGKFNAKFFNGEVFQKYIDRIPNPRKTELLKSRAIRGRPELASSMRDEVGGNYISTPLKGLISGSVPMNYDGNTDITPSSTETFMQSRVVVGRANAWAELDFSYDITGGEDFMENVAEQINDYWNEIDQDTLVAILKGVFSMTDTQGKKFVKTHTHDVTALLNADGKTGVMDATTMNTAIQRASGDQKGKFTLVLMHSVVATNLENLKLLTYLKYNDADGMQRDIGLATLNGRLVLVDDSMPVEHGYDAATAATAGAVKVVASDATTGQINLADVKKGDFYPANVAADAYVVEATHYISYVLGDGAIEYTDCGAKTPYEMDRNPAVKGGQDLLYSRQRKCWAPYGISFTKASMASASPTDAELAKGANWELVSSAGTTKTYIDPKTIPIARIISLG